MIKSLLIGMSLVWSATSYSDFKLNDFNSLESMSSASHRDEVVNFVIKDKSFSSSEVNLLSIFKQNALTALDDAEVGRDLLTVAEFIVNRDISTFREEALLHQGDISKMSGITLSEVTHNSDKSITFASNLPIVFGSIDSDNELLAFPFSELGSFPKVEKMVLATNQSGSDPVFITYQESFNFSNYLVRSQVLTLYFQKENDRSLIKSYTLSSLPSGMSFIVRKAMQRTIKSQISEIPEICEENGLKW